MDSKKYIFPTYFCSGTRMPIQLWFIHTGYSCAFGVSLSRVKAGRTTSPLVQPHMLTQSSQHAQSPCWSFSSYSVLQLSSTQTFQDQKTGIPLIRELKAPWLFKNKFHVYKSYSEAGRSLTVSNCVLHYTSSLHPATAWCLSASQSRHWWLIRAPL